MIRLQVHPNMVPGGFAMRSTVGPGSVPVDTSRILTSDDGPLLYTYLDQLFSEESVVKAAISRGIRFESARSVIWINKDLETVEIALDYISRFSAVGKAKLIQGQLLGQDDITDVIDVEMPNFGCSECLGWACVIRVGWRTGLAFDFSGMHAPGKPLSLKDAGRGSADLLNRLIFRERFLVPPEVRRRLFADGWFFFSRLPHRLVPRLAVEYAEELSSEATINEILAFVDAELLSRISANAHAKKALADHTQYLDRAIERYRASDYLSAVALLVPRIEGILRTSISRNDGRKKQIVEDFFGPIDQRVGRGSARLPVDFRAFLENFLGDSVDLSKRHERLGRNSFTHGIAPAVLCDQVRALQLLLTIDQLSWYME